MERERGKISRQQHQQQHQQRRAGEGEISAQRDDPIVSVREQAGKEGRAYGGREPGGGHSGVGRARKMFLDNNRGGGGGRSSPEG